MIEQYYMILNTVNGKIKGYYVTGIWEYNSILKEVRENEYLIEITKDVWNALIGNDKEIKIPSPKVKMVAIPVLTAEALDENKIIKELHMIDDIFEETIYEQAPYEPTQQEKDIKALAEILNGILEPMITPTDGQANPILDKVKDILNRY